MNILLIKVPDQDIDVQVRCVGSRDNAAINAALAQLRTAGITKNCLFRFEGDFSLWARIDLGGFDNSVIEMPCGSFKNELGIEHPLTADAAIGATVIPVEGATDYRVGMDVRLYSDTTWATGQMRRVVGVESDGAGTITIDSPLIAALVTTNNATCTNGFQYLYWSVPTSRVRIVQPNFNGSGDVYAPRLSHPINGIMSTRNLTDWIIEGPILYNSKQCGLELVGTGILDSPVFDTFNGDEDEALRLLTAVGCTINGAVFKTCGRIGNPWLMGAINLDGGSSGNVFTGTTFRNCRYNVRLATQPCPGNIFKGTTIYFDRSLIPESGSYRDVRGFHTPDGRVIIDGFDIDGCDKAINLSAAGAGNISDTKVLNGSITNCPGIGIEMGHQSNSANAKRLQLKNVSISGTGSAGAQFYGADGVELDGVQAAGFGYDIDLWGSLANVKRGAMAYATIRDEAPQ